MKKFKKLHNYYICEECGFKGKSLRSLSTHIQFKHNGKDYFDKWIKDNIDGLCKICEKHTEFISLTQGYKLGCCKKHSREWNNKQIEQAIFKKYGVKSALLIPNIKEYGMLRKYGVKNAFESKEIQQKIKNTNKKRYGVENPFQSEEIKKKIKNTNKKRYGTNYPSQSKEIQQKIKNSFLKKYGVEYALQNTEFYNKHISTSLKKGYFKKTGIYYQGSYELDFLERYYDKYPDIKRGPRIEYIFEGKRRYYFSDFLIPSLNLIVEIKNSYLAIKDKKIIESKKMYSMKKGFNWIMIIDKNYSEFKKTTQ